MVAWVALAVSLADTVLGVAILLWLFRQWKGGPDGTA